MTEESNRKLAVLLHADVAGSTALVQLNETVAHRRIRDTFLRFSEVIVANDGIAHEIRGDALVAEFSKASDALSASLDFQDANTVCNENLDDDIRAFVRVGIALGEVVVADNTITGEGIVLAQRLEQLAQPGGVCLHDAAYQTVPKRLAFSYEDLGEQALKGFSELVRAYVVRRAADARVEKDAGARVTDPVKLELPEEPSIAVMPFTNMSGDSEHEFFADGLSEDIITGLSSVRGLLVIARGSTFVYKGRNVDVKNIGRELGVRFVLEGSVRRSAGRCRVNVELVDAETGRPVWTRKYDRELTDLFELQDDIMQSVVASVTTQVIITEGRRERSQARADIRLWDLIIQVRSLLYDFTNDSLKESLDLAEQALSLYPDSDQANIAVASALYHLVIMGYDQDREASLSRARKLAERALQIHEEDEWSHLIMAWILAEFGEHRAAVEEVERGLEINPNFSVLHGGLADLLPYVGRPEDAIEAANRALRLNPLDPANFYRFSLLATCYFCLCDYPSAIGWARKAVQRRNTWIEGHLFLVASLSANGDAQEASSALEKFLMLFPDASITRMSARVQSLMYPNSFRDRLIESLLQTGLPN